MSKAPSPSSWLEKFRPLSWIVCGALVLLVAVLYFKVTKFSFLNWDDNLYVYNNPYIADFRPDNIAAWFTKTFVKLYLPLTLASYALDRQWFGADPAGFHWTNWFLHLINTSLAYFLFLRLWKRRWVAFLAGLIFAIHPAQVDTVAWISERKTLLCSLWILMAIHSLIPGNTEVLRFRFRPRLLALFFILALLSKPTAVMLPVFLLVSVWFLPDLQKHVPKAFLWGLSVAAAIFTAFALTAHPEVFAALSTRWPEILFFEPFVKLGNYLAIVIHPFMVCAFYPTPVEMFRHPGIAGFLYIACAAFFLVITALGTFQKKIWAFWALFALIWILPVVSPFSVPVKNHHLYLSLFGLVAALTTSLMKRPAFLGCIFLSLAVIYAPVTWAKMEIWRDSVSLWTRVLERYPAHYLAHLNLANFYADRGQLELSEKHYRKILGRPNSQYAYVNLVNGYLAQGRLKDAGLTLDEMQAKFPENADVYFLRASIVFARGQKQRAMELLNRSIEAGTSNPAVYFNLGMLYLENQNFQEALPLFEQAAKLDDRFADARYYLGICHMASGQWSKAGRVFREMDRKGLHYPGLYFQLGFVHFKLGNPQSAEKYYLRSLKADPLIPEPYYHLGVLAQDDPLRAQAFFEKAVSLSPGEARYREALSKMQKKGAS